MHITKVSVSRIAYRAGELAIQIQAETSDDNWQEDLKALTGKIDEYIQENYPPIASLAGDDAGDDDDDAGDDDDDEEDLYL